MNNNVVEKTLKSIDNIDRLSDLAAISIYNTSHEAIDKFDVMQEHATPEYVEGEFVQESLLTGVLIGAGIIGVAISAFLIIKKIIESKAKGDPNAAPNTVAGVNLLNPDEINKLFDGWNDKYFKNHPDLVAEDVPGADVSELNTYNGLLLESIRKFCDDATKLIDGLSELSDADMKAAIDDLNKEFDSNINMNDLVSKTGRVDKNTILQIKAAAEDISKTLREFDMQVTKCIEGFRNKEKNNQNSDSASEENKISEENIKLLEKALKAKANTAGTIMVNFRNKCLEGIAQALDAKVKETEGQAKAKQQQEQQKQDSEKELTPLTDVDKQSMIDIFVKSIKMGYEESDEDISNFVKEHHTASPEEIQEIINAVRAKTNGSSKESTGGPNPSQDDESINNETDGSSAETETPETENAEKKDETPSSENANQNIDIQYDGNWVVINGKPVAYSEEDGDNIERKWPDEDNETANKLITGLINRGESPLEAIEDINDLWEYGSRDGNIINFLNGIYSSRNNLDNPNDLKVRTECYNKCKIMAEVLGEPPVDELPKPDSVEKPSDDIKKISDTTGLDEGKVENIYKILKDNSTPDDVKRALIIDTIRPIMHMSGFNEDMTNKSFATNYANFKKVAEAANMPFEIELPKISEKDINNIHTIVDGAGTDETKLAKIADNLMNSTSTEKKDEGVEGDKEQELLSRITNGPTFAAEVAKAVENGIPEDYARTTLSSLTMSDGKYSLIKERLKDYDWLNDFKQREAYKKAYNHYNDALLYFTDKGIRDIPELKDELPDPTVEFPNALNDENVMQRVLAQYPVNPETLRKDLEYFQEHSPEKNLTYIIKDIIPKYFLDNSFTKSFEETVNQIRNYDIHVLELALINTKIAEFKPSQEVLDSVTNYAKANLEKLQSKTICWALADALALNEIFDPNNYPDLNTKPSAEPTSPSNSSTGSKPGAKQ